MSIDNYGLANEQYQEFFEANVKFAAELYLQTCNILTAKGVGSVDFKTVLDMYQEAVYATNDDCRRYQKANNPDALKDNDPYAILTPSREELMEEIQSVNAKVEGLADYIAQFLTVTTKGLENLID